MNRFSSIARATTISLASFAFAACGANGVPPSSPSHSISSAQTAQRRSATEPTLYVLNREVEKTAGWVGVYSNAGAQYVRSIGTIKNEGYRKGVDNYAAMTADDAGHLYFYQAKLRGQLIVYQKYGASILQTVRYKTSIFSALTLDRHGDLFAGCEGQRTFRVCEFPSPGHGTIEDTPSRKLAALPYWVATDPLGDVGASGGINGFYAFAPGKTKHYWGLFDGSTLYLSIAFDSASNLYVVQEARTGPSEIAVYARGATAPTYTITNGANATGQIAFDGSGNLYVANFCTSGCGTVKDSISVFAPGTTTPMEVLQPTANMEFGSMAVSKAGYVAVVEHTSSAYNGPVVVFAPGATTPSTTISTHLQFPAVVAFGE